MARELTIGALGGLVRAGILASPPAKKDIEEIDQQIDVMHGILDASGQLGSVAAVLGATITLTARELEGIIRAVKGEPDKPTEPK